MKKLSIILYVVLFLAVSGLYFLHFTESKKNKKSDTSGNVTGTTSQGIAYINIDPVIFKFDMFFDRRN